MKASEPVPGSHARLQQTMDPKDSIWLTSVQSGFLLRIVGLSLLLGLCSAGYIAIVECYPNSSRTGSTVEDQDSIVVSGDVDQQRDAVLANFVKYGNKLRASKNRRDDTGNDPNSTSPF
jgi:hypothetical protein